MKIIPSSRRGHYAARASIFLITVALIAGMAGCDGYTPPSKNLEIRTWYDLDKVRNNLGGHHVLMNDLDSTTAGYEELASPTANEGKGWKPIGYGYWVSALFGAKVVGEIFKGTLDGQVYEIRDIYINSQGQVGLFGFVAEGGIIKNITLINATLTTGEAAGGPVGLNEDTVRCFDVASVGGVGGLVGYNGGTVSNCYAMGNITGDSGVGGLVGYNEGAVSNCYATGRVTGNYNVGGLVGINRGTVRNSCSTGSVSGNEYVGGLVGLNDATVSNSYYNYDKVLINGENVITIGALFGEDFEEWAANDKFLDINDRLSKEDGYYVINDVADFKELLAFGQDNSLKFRLTNDLDLGDEANLYIPYLSGEFDGNGHKISDLNFNFGFVSYVGLFGYLAPCGKVTQLGVENIDITGAQNVGGLVGANWEGTVSSCYAKGSVTGKASIGGLMGRSDGTVTDSHYTGSVTGEGHVGGLIGANYFGSVSNSYSTGTMTGTWGTGGVVGYNWEGTVINSYSTGKVTGASWVGGLVGYNHEGTVSNSYSTGTITGGTIPGTWGTGGVIGGNTGTVSNCYSRSNVTCDELVGGLVGYNYKGTVSNSCSTGSVSGNVSVGGLVGKTWYGTVSNCYSKGSVTGNDDVGGLVGANWDGTVSNSYSTGSVIGNADVGGLVGWNKEGTVRKSFWDTETSGQATSAGGTGKSTAEMKDIATFSDAGWNIVAVAPGETNDAYTWNIVDKQTYPFLSWES